MSSGIQIWRRVWGGAMLKNRVPMTSEIGGR